MSKLKIDSHRIIETDFTNSVGLAGKPVRLLRFSSCDENRAKVSIVNRAGKRREMWIDTNLLERIGPLN